MEHGAGRDCIYTGLHVHVWGKVQCDVCQVRRMCVQVGAGSVCIQVYNMCVWSQEGVDAGICVWARERMAHR